MSVDQRSKHIIRLSEGSVFTFREMIEHFEGDETVASKVLMDLKRRGKLLPLGRGLWQCPKHTPFGIALASVESVVAALERTEDVFIVPGGAQVLNEIGASTQVPMRHKFVVTRRIQPIQLGKQVIEFEYRRAFATFIRKLADLPEAERRVSGKLWVALDYADERHTKSEIDAFREALNTLSGNGKSVFLSALSGKLVWARKMLS